MTTKHLQIILFVLLIIGSTLSGDKIKLKLHQPPPNKMPVASLWKMDIENTTKDNITIYLEGSVAGDKQGEIVKGTSKPFSVKPGKHTYGYDDFKSGEVIWKNKSIQEVIIRTGEVPSDVYTICVAAYYESGEVADREQCITHPVEKLTEGIITLISPSDGEEVNPETGINFVWTGTGKQDYTIKIAELRSGQTKEEAIKSKGHFEIDKIKTTTFSYPTSAPKLTTGKKYAWIVTTGSGVSEIWTFTAVSENISYNIKFSKFECTSTPGKYNFEIELKVDPATTYQPVKINSSSDITIINAVPVNSLPIALNFTNTFPVSINSFPGTGIVRGSLITASNTPLASVRFKISERFYYTSADYITKEDVLDTIPPCGGGNEGNTNCCLSFRKIINQSVRGNVLNVNLKAGPNKISKVSMDLVYVNAVTDNGCPLCKNNWRYWGNFYSGPRDILLEPFGSIAEAHNRELIWGSDKGPGYDIYTTPATGRILLRIDPVTSGMIPTSLLRCCKTDIRYCIRYSFTEEKTCITCDTVVCGSFSVGGRNNTDTNNYYEEEIRKDGEGQGFSSNENIDTKENTNYNSATPVPVTVNITSDNAYVFGFGKYNEITTLFSPDVCNMSAGEIYNNAPGVETYPINADLNGYVYIVAWSDNSSYEGLIAEFISGTKTIKTNLASERPNAHWEVYATGEDLIINGRNIQPDELIGVTPRPQYVNVNCPTITALNNYITTANSNSGDNNSTSVGWVTSTNSGPNVGKLIFGPDNDAMTNDNMGVFPPGIVSRMSSDANWIWYSPSNSITNPFVWSNFGNTPPREYYIFRIGPLGDLIDDDDCCSDRNIKVTGNIQQDPKEREKYVISTNITAGPNKIQRVIAEIIDFSISYNSDLANGESACRTCVNNSDLWGNFRNPVTQIPGLGKGKLTFPRSFADSLFSHEVVWGKINGPAVDLTRNGANITLPVSIPPKNPSPCCADTIKICVKYKFYDEKCVECDTIVCYKIVRSPQSHGFNINEEDINGFKTNINIQENKNISSYNNASGQTSGSINVDIDKTSEVKITLFDAAGKKIMNMYDDYMKEGQYSIDLGRYNLPEGIYFYRIDNGISTKYEKVLIAKSCNCGK